MSLPPAHPWLHAEQRPDAPALIAPATGERRTFRELADNANRWSHLFRASGLVPGDTIALLMENRLEYLEICWGAKDAGLHYACVSTHIAAKEAAYVIGNSDARVLVTSARLLPVARLIDADPARPCRRLIVGDDADGFERAEPLLARQPTARPPPAPRGASMLYSSGTTGLPKGVRTPLGEEPPETPPPRIRMLIAQYGFGPDTVFLDNGPLYHAAPQRFAMTILRLGGCVLVMDNFDAEAALRAIETCRATHAFFVPTMFVRLLKLPEEIRQRYSTASLTHAIHGSAPCPVSVKQRMIDWWGPVIYELYGSTEGFGHTFITSAEWLAHPGSVGRAPPGCELHVVDAEGTELPPGEIGVIYMYNGRQFEYYKDAAKTQEIRHHKGWLTLGDMGYLDTEGYLYLTDRQSHMIISGGVNIYPAESEHVLVAHPAVADVAVIGVPNEEFGEEVKAIVQLEPGHAPSPALAQELLDFCRAGLSSIKCPRSVDFIDRLPRADSGKIFKRQLRERYWQGRGRII